MRSTSKIAGDLLDSYSETALKRIWRAEHFSYWMTSMMHRTQGASPFEQQLQVAELEHVATSRAAATAMAENYVGVAASRSRSDWRGACGLSLATNPYAPQPEIRLAWRPSAYENSG